MEDDALNVLADKGKPHFDIIEEKRISPEWKARRLRRRTIGDQSCSYVSRSSLVVGKRTQRIRATAEESLRQRNRLLCVETGRRRKRANGTELGLSGQNDRFREPIICRVAQQHPAKATLRPKELSGKPNIGRIVHAPMRIARIIPPVLHKVNRYDANAHWREQLGHEQYRDDNVADAHAPIGVTKQSGWVSRCALSGPRRLHRSSSDWLR